jgi:hypothetical protein
MTSKIASLAEAIALVRNGDTVALGGHTLRRHPMAAAAEIIRQRKRDLHVLGWNSGIEFDLLVGAGCVKVVETSYVGISGFRARQELPAGGRVGRDRDPRALRDLGARHVPRRGVRAWPSSPAASWPGPTCRRPIPGSPR